MKRMREGVEEKEKTMRVAIGQIDTTIGDLAGNTKKILEACRLAADQGARVIVLPELVVTGYPPRDLLNVHAFLRATDAAVEEIVRELPQGLVAIFGAPRGRRGDDGIGGRALTDSAIAAERGTILLEVAKALLPTYDVFDERRYFEPAPAHVKRVLEVDDERIGILVCEDMWNDRLLWADKRIYDRDPFAEAVEQGATLVVNVSASPFSQRKYELRRQLVRHAAKRWHVPVVYANAVGGNDGLLFDGGSLAAAADGEAIAELPWFETAVRVLDLNERTTLATPDPMDILHRALVTGVRDYARKTGIRGWVLGLSGGVDSALVATIGTLALGNAAGAAIAMPSRYSSDHSIGDARALATNLGLPFHLVPIEPVHAAYEGLLDPLLAAAGQCPGDVTMENVQARVRGAILMAWANRTNGLLLTTGNKSECSVGYCTLYGDMAGGLAVIADLWKHEVYGLCHWLNANKVGNAIPLSTLTKPPSAELRPGQRDDQSLPPYDILDPIMKALVEDELGPDDAAAATGQSLDLVRSLAQKLYLAEYKRKQFAPTLKVSARAWVGRDYPIAMGWRP
jgi:NAD+ synthase (glutamine-hydrolysing)